MKKHVTVIDPTGALLEGNPVAISHRFIIDGQNLHGYESVIKQFDDHNDFMALVQVANGMATGSSAQVNRFTVEVN